MPSPIHDIVEPFIRPYEPADRNQVRQISHRTGLMGESIDLQWRHLDSWAEVFTGYYTDEEPESASVVELNGNVVGYLLGCKETNVSPDPGVVGLKQALKYGLLVRPGTAGFIWRTVGDTIADTTMRRVKQNEFRLSDPRWPAHFHINLLPEVRHRGIGSKLVQGWLQELDRQGIPGCHIQTLTESNTSPAIKFFERQGFQRLGRAALLPGMRSPSGGRIYDQKMIIDL